VIAVVDTGGANLASVTNAIGRLGRAAELTSDPARLRAASHVILPGVGAAADAMAKLDKSGLVPVVKALTQPVLGICLGMQLFFERSTEGDVRCLGLLPGAVTAIPAAPERGVTVPHMGWNDVRRHGPACKLLDGMAEGAYFYFVHTYQAPDGPWVRGVTEHGGPVVAVVEHQNFVGVQFHPERSGPAGAAMLERFFSL
jgi:glutamine amidotransferase